MQASRTTRNYKKDIQAATYLDDLFMTVVLSHFPEVTQFVLRIIMEMPDLELVEILTQPDKKSFFNRSIRLDVLAKDSKGRLYNIEVQNADEGAEPKRARYHSSVIDSDYLKKGAKFNELPETYVIFITENDVIGGNKPLYHIDRRIEEMKFAHFKDEQHIIFANTAYRGRKKIVKLFHDLICSDPDKMNYPELAAAARYFKEDDKGVIKMCRMMDKIVKEENKAAVQDAIKQERRRNFAEMSKDGVPKEKIKKYLGISDKEYKELLSVTPAS